MAQELATEFPELCILHLTLDVRPGRSPEPVRRRLRGLASRLSGGQVVHMRQDPVPWAYRVFWRQVGLDPDTDRTPIERIAFDRLRWGGLPSRGLLDDAITIATLETGVPLTAFDAARVGSPLGLRLTEDAELLGGGGRPLAARQIVISDSERPLALLGGEVAEERGVTPSTGRMSIAAIQVRGVPRISVEEALWTVTGTLLAAG